MALRKGLWLPSTSYLPEDDRLGLGALWYPSGSTTNILSVRSGVIQKPQVSGHGPLQVFQATGMTASVGIGQMVYAGANNSNQGAYLVTNDSTATVTFTTADPSNPRIDVVYVLVTDTSEGDATNNTVFGVQAGTPAVSPSAPSVPTGAFPLANVQIRAGTASVLTSDITDKRQFTTPYGTPLYATQAAGTGGIGSYDGQEWFQPDTVRTLRYMGGVWQQVTPDTSWTAYTPTWTATTTNPTVGTGGSADLSARYRYIAEKQVLVQYHMRFGSTGASSGSGFWRLSLPVTAAANENLYSVGTGITTNGVASDKRSISCHALNTTQIELVDATGGAISNSVPYAWASSTGEFSLSYQYTTA